MIAEYIVRASRGVQRHQDWIESRLRLDWLPGCEGMGSCVGSGVSHVRGMAFLDVPKFSLLTNFGLRNIVPPNIPSC